MPGICHLLKEDNKAVVWLFSWYNNVNNFSYCCLKSAIRGGGGNGPLHSAQRKNIHVVKKVKAFLRWDICHLKSARMFIDHVQMKVKHLRTSMYKMYIKSIKNWKNFICWHRCLCMYLYVWCLYFHIYRM